MCAPRCDAERPAQRGEWATKQHEEETAEEHPEWLEAVRRIEGELGGRVRLIHLLHPMLVPALVLHLQM